MPMLHLFVFILIVANIIAATKSIRTSLDSGNFTADYPPTNSSRSSTKMRNKKPSVRFKNSNPRQKQDDSYVDSRLKRDLWCPDSTLCASSVNYNIQSNNRTLLNPLCQQRWLFVIVASDHPRNEISMRVKKFIVQLELALFNDVQRAISIDSTKTFAELSKFATKFKSQGAKKLFGAFLHNPIDMPRLYRDIQSFFRQSLWTGSGEDRQILVVAGSSVAMTRDLHFLKTVFPCSRIIYEERVLVSAGDNGTVPLMRQLFPRSSYALNASSISSHSLLQWMGVSGCTPSRTDRCDESGVRCLEGRCRIEGVR